MTDWFARYSELYQMGNARQLVLELVKAAETDDEPDSLADLILNASDAFLGWPVLFGDDATYDAANALVSRERPLHAHKLRQLCKGDLDVPGTALFPVVVWTETSAVRCGALREIRVHAAKQSLAFEQGDTTFRRAIERARSLADKLLPRRAGEEHWSVFPDVRSNTFLAGGSVGLAALVAFVSFRVGRPVKPGSAFSGVVDHDALAAVQPETLPFKMRGLNELPSIVQVFVPGYREAPAGVTPPDGCSWYGTRNPEEVLDRVLGDDWRTRRGHSTVPPRPAMAEIDARIMALACVARIPLERTLVEDSALSRESWNETVDTLGILISDRIRYLASHGHLAETFGGIARAADASDRPGCDARHLSGAHCTLARELWMRTDPALRREAVYHAIASADLGLAARYVGELSAAEPHSADWLLEGLLGDSFGPAVDLATWTKVVEMLDASAASTLLRLLSANRRLPSGIAHALAPAGQPVSWVDRLLCLHAASESALHVLASASIALQRNSTIPRAEAQIAELGNRPSLGRLAFQVHHLLQYPDAPLAGALSQSGVASLVQPGSDLTEDLNELLHHFGALSSWTQGGDQRAREAFASLGRRVYPALRDLGDFFANHTLSETTPSASSTPPCVADRSHDFPVQLRLAPPDQTLSLAGLVHVVRHGAVEETVHYRGVVDGSVRYWPYDSAREYRVPVRSEGSPTQFLLAPPSPLPAMQSFDLERRDLSSPSPAPSPGLLPLALALPLKHYQDAARRGSVLAMLGCLDLLIGALLRLAWFSALSTTGESPVTWGKQKPPWVARMTKRNLHAALVEYTRRESASEEGKAAQGLVATVASQGAAERCSALISILERLEHAPGPMSAHLSLVEAGYAHLLSLLAACVPELTLAALEPSGHYTHPLQSPQPPPPPGSTEGTLLELATLRRGAVFPLWPWVVGVRMRGRVELLILVDAEGPSRPKSLTDYKPRYLSMLPERLQLVKPAWEPDPTSPLGIRVLRSPEQR